MNRSGLSIRAPLEKFVEQQELVLRNHDHKGEFGWRKQTIKELHERLHMEMDELDNAMDAYEDTPDVIERGELIRECCDVANFAMFITDFLDKEKDG